MSLQVGDPRSRGRSKSPGGRIRDHSRSRDTRQPSANPRTSSQYLTSDPLDDDGYHSSRTRGASPGASYRTSSRYNRHGSDSDHEDRSEYLLRPERSSRDKVYLSDTGEGRSGKRSSRTYAKSPARQPARYDVESDDDILDSEDEALAYGDMPGATERGFYGSGRSPRSSSSRVDPAMMSGALKAEDFYKQPASRSGDPRPAEAPGAHPSYARPDPFKYAMDPSQYLHGPSAVSAAPGYTGAPATAGVPSNWAAIPDCERPGFVPPSSQGEGQAMPGAFPPATTNYPQVPAARAFPTPQYANPEVHQYASWATSNAYVPPVTAPAHQRHASGSATVQYADPPQFQYANIDPNVKYASKSSSNVPSTAAPQFTNLQSADPKYQGVRYSANPQFSAAPTGRAESKPQFMEIAPGGRPASASFSSGNKLSVATADPNLRPASPMLEPYKGTYQSISPMPSPIVMPGTFDEEVSDLEPLDGPSDADADARKKHGRKKSKDIKDKDSKGLKEPKSSRSKRDSSRVRHERHSSNGHLAESLVLISPSSARKRVSFYDASADAAAMQEALSGRTDPKVLIRVLPQLTGDEMLDLRKEYKNYVKLHGKGVNIAKHLRTKLGHNAFSKVCYATALGPWESEAFWANCYYQSSTSRRELLIESLFGRSNSEIIAIKECFRDTRYSNSLEKCMKAELKADKFRLAVLLALEAKRQGERDPINLDMVQRDVHDLHRALMSRHGGETDMINIIVPSSDAHLREVLRTYEKIYERNFARAMIAKSQNLVGETLAHILNGVINRPMRDALLLHQALRESRSGKERSELLISRLVRYHWEPQHLELVKVEFRKRYGERLEEAIAEEVLPTNGGSEWGEFCIELARSSRGLAKRV
ncbi:annexin ANXC4 [Aspergillus candidus]|uniref:Annexin ANXC4 n=1 Tax=Aspergillus candidus TaxID=41067 RepID=A0A2I2EY47_ASPCN|nr:annexin ANXC4 [Aspergillus candidus]PLB33284.1 annexin ANXC4 [Aspergillus candidus]